MFDSGEQSISREGFVLSIETRGVKAVWFQCRLKNRPPVRLNVTARSWSSIVPMPVAVHFKKLSLNYTVLHGLICRMSGWWMSFRRYNAVNEMVVPNFRIANIDDIMSVFSSSVQLTVYHKSRTLQAG